MKLDSREPAHRLLDKALARFVDQVLAGDDEAALLAFGDAQALMPAPRAVLDEGRSWVATEQQLVAQINDHSSDSAAQASLAALRGRGGRR